VGGAMTGSASGNEEVRYQCCECDADVTDLVTSACAEESVGILVRSREKSVTVFVSHTAKDGTEHTCSYECPA
jgi:hypothetical protein